MLSNKTIFSGYLMFSLGTEYKWSYIFKVMEESKVQLSLKDYSVAQTTLEQVRQFYCRTRLTLC